jgi:hypothetical protein
MQKKLYTITILLLISISYVQATDKADIAEIGNTEEQLVGGELDKKVDTIGLEAFWQENVIPFINKDQSSLSNIITFPLEGSWSFALGFDKVENLVSSAEFFESFEKIFDQNCINKLKELNYYDTQTYIGDGYTQLIVSNGWEIPYTNEDGSKNHKEGGIILRFKKIKNQWQLFSMDSIQ